MNKEFTFHKLNKVGIEKAMRISKAFDSLLEEIKEHVTEGREFALTKTYLEQACFFCKKAMALDPANHDEGNPDLCRTLKKVKRGEA